MDRPIPAFYCVYLLRSAIRPSRPADFYIGSTPNPTRRQKQHNGISKGGAKRTQRVQKRPWSICLMLSGFTSKISALQFEWAWQNTYKTRHLSHELRARASPGVAHNAKSKKGRSFVRTMTAARGLPALLNDLALLMSCRSFARLPLTLRTFQQDVGCLWNKQGAQLLTVPFKISSDLSPPHHETIEATSGSLQIKEREDQVPDLASLETSHAALEQPILRNLSRLSSDRELTCSICSHCLNKDRSLILFCSHANCDMASHMTCVARLFVKGSDNEQLLLPTSGACPCCSQRIDWSDLVRELSLRTRGKASVAKLLRSRCRPAVKSATDGLTHGDASQVHLSVLDESEEGSQFGDDWLETVQPR